MSDMSWVGWVAVASTVALLLAAGALWIALANRRALRGRGIPIPPAIGAPGSRGTAATDQTDAAHTLVAFVANPTKPGVPALRDAAVQACAARYLPEPMWFETTAEDPGVGQTREAIARGAQLVVAVGGDGTVRAVAEGVAGTDVAMGLVPQGTGNLLARNLDLPLGDVDALLRIALTGTERPIDVGWLTVVRDEAQVSDDIAEADPHAVAPQETPPDTREPARDHIFLVIAGLGFDAAMVADADEELKAKVGWIAYFVAGVKHLHARRLRLQMSLDDSPWFNVRLRSVLIGNCGKLPGGVVLLPDAVLDDGWLDVAAIDTRVGLLGWTQLFGEVALQRFGVRTRLPNKAGRIDHARSREVRVRTRDAQQIQVDGDIIGRAFEVAARVDPLALRVRVADPAAPAAP
ncbi:sphingosine kinase [Actinotalea fermentans]|uniref:Sphingosine kinase n=2 Tax=Actinotalea fermentans TaxID=43671 RepID=A0A511YZ15_9CELL|nr:sphingosine kinase [Actinotalea fermentans]